MSPPRLLLIIGAMILALPAVMAQTRAHDQFTQIPTTFPVGKYVRATIEGQCRSPYLNYTDSALPDPPNMGHTFAVVLFDCVLDSLPEWVKAEMGSVSIILGLVPGAISQFGPTTTEIALLFYRRPLLATLLAFGSPAVSQGSLDTAGALRAAVPISCVPGFLGRRRLLNKALISTVEYLLVLAAVGNILFQVWFLTYRAVCWSAIQIWYTQYAPETVVPLFWVLFAIPVQWIANWAMRLRVREAPQASDLGDKTGGWHERTGFRRAWFWLRRHVVAELTPCVYGQPFTFGELPEGYVSYLTKLSVFILSIAHLFMGTIVLSTMFFIALRHAIGLVCALLAGAIVCKVVLLYELYGMRESSSGVALGRYSMATQHET